MAHRFNPKKKSRKFLKNLLVLYSSLLYFVVLGIEVQKEEWKTSEREREREREIQTSTQLISGFTLVTQCVKKQILCI
jgi:hypothetical protein